MTVSKFKTLRHIETVRNFLNQFAIELLRCGEKHDQCKLQSPEAEIFEEYTEKLRTVTYGSDEYKSFLASMKPALDHHYAKSRHHPEHFENGVNDMDLIDLIELMCDWKASTMRHNDGNLLKSLDINRIRFNMSDQLYNILLNTAKTMERMDINHHAEES